MSFSKTLRNLTEEKGITQKQLALDLEIPVSTVGGYFQGTSEPDFETLKLIAKYFNVSIDYLLDYKSGVVQTTGENELLRVFRSLNSDEKTIYLNQGKVFIRFNEENI